MVDVASPSPPAAQSIANELRRGASRQESRFRQASEVGYNDRPQSIPGQNGPSFPASASLDELELAGKVRQLFLQARAARRERVARWNRSYRILRNRTWSATRDAWLPTPEVPEIYPIIAAIVGWQTDQRPSWDVSPWAIPNTPSYIFYQQLAQDLQVCLDSTWAINDGEPEVEQVTWDGHIYGTGIFKSCWDSSLEGGLGNAVLRRVDPYTWYPDPQATSLRDCNYIIEARTMSLQEIDRRWPGSIDKLQQGFVDDIDVAPDDLSGSSSFPKANPGAISPNTNPSYGRPGQSRINASSAITDPGVTVFECWIREHSKLTTFNQGQADDLGYYGSEHVLDTWRVVVVAGNRILMDEKATDLWSHGQHPYDLYIPHRTGQIWGVSMVEMLTPSQLSINRLLAALQLNTELTGNPVWVEETRAGLSRTKITNRPGTRLQKNPNSQAGWEAPPPVNPMMFQLIEFYITEMERISGLSAISRGMTPTGRNSSGVIDQIQEASFVRIRMAMRNMEWSLRSVGNKLASLICENYTVPRIVNVIGQQGEQQARALHGNHFYLATENGRAPMKFNLNVQAGSQQATSRQARIGEVDALYAMGAITEMEVLEAHNFPNWPAVAEKVMNLKATGAMQPPGARQRSGRSH